MAIISVGQEYESMEKCYDYQTEIETTYGEQSLPIKIRKSNENFKDRNPKCFNCKIYRYMARDCKKPKKKKDTQKYYKCRRTEHIARDCRTK